MVIQHDVYCRENADFLSQIHDSHRNKIDLCYIDPPYNSGNSSDEFTYQDKFLGSVTYNSHEVWVHFMRERLEKTVALLKSTGIIAISIDDREVCRLRLLLDSVFGEHNFIAQVVIDGGSRKNNARFISTTHEYLLIYAKSLPALKRSNLSWRVQREGLEIIRKKEKQLRQQYNTDYKKITEELKSWVKTAKLSERLKKFTSADARGLYTVADLSAPGSGKLFDVSHPQTKLSIAAPSRGWGLSQEKFAELVAEDMIVFGEGPDGHLKQPLRKHYLRDEPDQTIGSVWSGFPARTSTHLLQNMLGRRKTFTYPKNLSFIRYIVETMCPPDGLVLDYFAGSGTTGHAVIDSNRESAGNRTFLLCTNNENNIFDEVTRPRLEAARTGIWADNKKHPASEDLIKYH